ncbi:MAG: threonine synthase [Lentisphaerales bacterium]|nr:MAG: threonine synthase [Lentisphaerales bacterium]
MNYVSTRGGIEPMSFKDTVMSGLAADGGLLLPDEIPDVSDRLADWQKLTYRELATEIIALYSSISSKDAAALVHRSYSAFSEPEVVRMVAVGDLQILELFHGPTLSFKDIALQFLGNLFEALVEERGGELNIVVATSGDTGSAAIHGVRGRENMRIFVLHPHGRVSPSQRRQMTTVSNENVFNVAIDGTFDDCQGIVKSIFTDLPFKTRYSLGAVNSINWARILAQIVYYFFAAFRTMESTGLEGARFVVPTGNFGDIFAGYLARKMGLPVTRLVLATNENDILSRFFESGTYALGEVHTTISPSMDIQVASNFERYLYYRLNGDPAAVGRAMAQFRDSGSMTVERQAGEPVDEWISSGSADTQQTLEVIRSTYKDHGYLLDPHSAVGVHVALSLEGAGEPTICLATAHPAKFSESIGRAVGSKVARHEMLDRLTDMPEQFTVLPSSLVAVRGWIEESLSAG